MTPYPEYKDSGIEWLGEIPAHWEVRKVSRSFKQISSGTTPQSGNTDYYENGEYSWLQTGDLNDGFITKTSKAITSKALNDYSALKMYSPGSFVIAMYGATIGKVGITEIEVCTNQACCVLNNSPYFDIRFIYYWVIANRRHIISLSYGGGQPNISQELVRMLRIPAPPLSEQSKILAYLDHKTQALDELIADKRRLIELYQEERSALINQAVTRGLDPDAPMKDSGIAWLGEIPAHWEVKRLKFMSREVSVGIVVTPAKYYQETGVPALRSLNVKPMKVNLDDCVFISDESNDLLKKSKLEKDDIVVVRTGKPGTAAVIPEVLNGCNCIDLILIRKSPIFYSTYLAHFLNSEFAKIQYASGSGGAIQLHFNVETAKNLIIPLPNKKEQNEILSFVTNTASQIDTQIADTEREIELLQEYRTALISEAVTGKIDVRNMIPQSTTEQIH